MLCLATKPGRLKESEAWRPPSPPVRTEVSSYPHRTLGAFVGDHPGRRGGDEIWGVFVPDEVGPESPEQKGLFKGDICISRA